MTIDEIIRTIGSGLAKQPRIISLPHGPLKVLARGFPSLREKVETYASSAMLSDQKLRRILPELSHESPQDALLEMAKSLR